MVKLFSKNSNLCDHNLPTSQTDRQTDRQTTTCDRNTALCTKVHRAVKVHQLWNGDDYSSNIIRIDFDGIWQKYSKYSRIAGVLMLQSSCRFTCYHVIVSLKLYTENNAYMLCASVSCWACLFAALETQMFGVQSAKLMTDGSPASRKKNYLTVRWLWGLSSWLSNSDSTLCRRRFRQYSHCVRQCPDACRLFRTSPAACGCFSLSNLFGNSDNKLPSVVTCTYRYSIKILWSLLNGTVNRQYDA